MRLQKFMAACGVASRRKSEEIIQEGRVKVNDKIITTLGTQVEPENDQVTVDDKPISSQTECKYYLAFNKPKGVVTTANDPQGRKTILDYFKDFPVRLFTVGRLDYHTSGLIFLTNDGEFANKVSHPRHESDKEYEVKCKGILTPPMVQKLRKGIYIDKRLTMPAKVEILGKGQNTTKVLITITEGRNRQIRKMFDAIGHTILNLKRVRIGPVRLENLTPGTYKMMDNKAIKYFLNK